MRIGLIASARHPIRPPFAGGLERHTHELASGLRERGHDVVVFASGDSDPDLGVEALCPRSSQLDLSQAAREDVSMLSDGFMAEHHAYLHLMRRLADRDDLDVVHNSSLHYLPLAMAATLPAPLVTTLHTPPTPWIESAVGIAADAGTFVSVSRRNAASWTRVRVHDVIPNGIDLRVWAYRPDPDPDLAIWTGRIVPEKGTHLAVHAAHRAGMRIHLAGPADPSYMAEVLPLLGPGDAYLGHLGQRDLSDAVGAAAVAVCTPRWDEPFGLVAPEALACGTPVAAFARGALPEILDDATGRLARPDDVTDLARAIARARHLDRAACRRRAESDFAITAMVGRYESLYLELAA